MNSFFIVNSILQAFPAISTNSPFASAAPVIWVVSMNLIFELVSDLRRWRSDRKVNNLKVKRLQYDPRDKQKIGKYIVTSADLQVGDMIVLDHDDQIPADCVILQTDDPNGQCFINTSQLDGESNLKPKLAPRMVQEGKIENFLVKKAPGECVLQLDYI